MEELVEQAKKGNKEAFSSLVISIQDEMYRISKIRLKNEEDIYDAIQETVIIAFKSIKKLKHIEYFKTWIIRILINQCNHIYRKTKQRNIIQYEEIENTPKVNMQTDKVDTKLDFNFLCNKLKKEDRTIIILYYMERYTDKEIGQILKLNENTVRTKRTRAKQKIKKILESEEKSNG